MSDLNEYCQRLGLSRVKISELKINKHPGARALLLAVLLELGRPVTLIEAAALLEHYGFGDSDQLLSSLQKARPGAPPFFRGGEFYELDTNDRDLWYMALRLDLKITSDQKFDERSSDLHLGTSFPTQTEGRCVAYTFPENEPKILSIIDECSREIRTYCLPESLVDGVATLKQFSTIVGLNPRRILESLGIDLQGYSFVDLSQHTKSRTINKSGRKLKITTELLIASSCGISRPFGDSEKMLSYIVNGQTSKLKARSEANVKSLFWFHNYTRLHGCAFLRWGFLEEDIEIRFVPLGNRSLTAVVYSAIEKDLALEVVCGSAPGWENPWARAIKVIPRKA